MLTLRGVGVTYGDRWVLRGLDLTLPPGERAAVLGPSGCGKTTLLRVAAGLLTPREGRADRSCRRLAYAFQEPRLVPWLSLEENLLLVLGEATPPAPVRDLAERFGLTPLLKQRARTLSGGQRQRAGLVRALSVRPDLLLLDEPFASLDRPTRDRLLKETADRIHREGTALLLVTHDPTEARTLAERILELPDLAAPASDLS